MGKLKYPDTASRNAAIASLEKKRAEIQSQQSVPKKAQDELINANKSQIDARKSVQNQLDQKKSISNILLIVGVIAIAFAVLFMDNLIPMIAIIAVGVLIAALGIFIKLGNSTTQLKQTLEKMNKEMSEFDKQNSALKSQINSFQGQINSINGEIEAIKREEKLAHYYEWCDEISHGNIALFVSIKYEPFAPPEDGYTSGKRYDGGTSLASFKGAGIYMDDMLYASIEKYGDICFAKADPGTHKLQVAVNFTTGNNSKFQRASTPEPFRSTDASQFVRIHLHICSKGTQTTIREFYDFDEFLADIGMSVEEFMQKYI